MHTISGVLMLFITVAFFFYYRPKTEAGIWTCVICAVMGLLTPVVPTHTWFLQLISVGAKALVLVCCYLQLSRENRERKADEERARRVAERQKLHQLLEDEPGMRPAA